MKTAEKSDNTGEERRTHQRYRVREGALAFLGALPGRITDISMSGMSVTYVPLEKVKSEHLKIDLFVPGQDFYLPGISCHLIAHTDCPSNAPFNAVQVKQMRVEFCDLTFEQESGLKFFFQHNTFPVS